MDWNGSSIKFLRRRLGWSQSDLARRLSCKFQLIQSWENDHLLPENGYLQALELLSHQMDEHAIAISQFPRAELMIDENELGQVDLRIIDHNNN